MTFLSFEKEFLMLQLFKLWLTIAKFPLIVLTNIQHFLFTQILGLKIEEKCFFVIQIPETKVIGKTAAWTIFSFWVSPLNYPNWEVMFLMQQSHEQ